MLSDARLLVRFAGGLRSFFREPAPDVEEARSLLALSLAQRAEAFLHLLERAVYAVPESPYRWLLQRAGLGLEDVRHLVHTAGLDWTLGRLLDEGVYLTLDEFKGRRSLRRGSGTFALRPDSCDNPVLTPHFATTSSGSSGRPRRFLVDLDLLRYEAATNLLFCEAAGVLRAPFALWRPVPPGSAGIKRALTAARLRLPFERWFTPQPYHPLRPDSKSWGVTTAAVVASRLAGCPIPVPEEVTLDSASRVAAWLAGHCRQGVTAHLDVSVSAALLVVQAAAAAGLDLSGAFLRTGSEPLTPARAGVLAAAGCRTLNHYAIAETGPVGMACTHPEHIDDVHVLEGKMAAISRAGAPGVNAPADAEPLFLTTLLPAAPKVMINVESGDTAVREVRPCPCVFGSLGYHTRLHTIRSYEKLTAGGMHFLGSALLRLIEEVLPGAFGGSPADYQFAEVDDEGPSRVDVRVHPRLGPVDEKRVLDVVLGELAAGSPADRMMASQWRQGEVLRVRRAAPVASGGAKILPLRFRSGG